VDLWHEGGAFSHSRRNALGRARPNIADGKNVGVTGLKREDTPVVTINRASGIGPGHYETFFVHGNAAIQPRSVRICANEQEEMAQATGAGDARLAVTEYRGS
jgi:hypothetical protein